MTYAKGIKKFIDRYNKAIPPDFSKLPLKTQRKLYCELTRVFPYSVSRNVLIVDDKISVEGEILHFRKYLPKQKADNGLLIYIRGGGFVLGSLETHNTLVAELCDKTGLLTIAPDFRMAPEHPFPTALEDCYNILCKIVLNASHYGIDPKRIVICGDSSGANMAISISMMCRDRHGPTLRGQALISPVLDFTRWRHGGQDVPLLTGSEMEYYTACYTPDPTQTSHQYVSQLIAGSFHDLPPAYIMGTGLDSLLVDSQEYARRLSEHHINVELVIEPGLVHAPIRARGLSPQVAGAWQRYCQKAAKLTYINEVTYGNE